MWINQQGVTVRDNEAYTAPDGTSYPGNFPKAEIPGLTWVADPVPTPEELVAKLAEDKSVALKRLDADVDAIYGAVLGNRAEEYNLAATEAQKYKDANYTGTVPGSVQSWATAKSWEPIQAADDILATAAQWVGAQSAIRAARLTRKEQVRNAANADGVNTALAGWAGFATYIRGQLGVL